MRALKWFLGVAVLIALGSVWAGSDNPQAPTPPLGLPPIIWPEDNPYTPEKR